MQKKIRITYFFTFILLLLVEICIALFVDDRFIRPYIGDVLVVVLMCAFLRIIFPEKARLLPLFVTAFSILVEILQYFDFVELLGLENIQALSIALGRTFDFKDIICYITGGTVFFICEILLRRKRREY